MTKSIGLALVPMVLVACGSIEPVDPGIPLPTHWACDAGGLAYEGTLVANGPCIWLDGGEPGLNLLWPGGCRLGVSDGAIITPAGEAVAHVGDGVFLDGSAIRDPIGPPGCSVRRGAAVVPILELNGLPVAPTDRVPTRTPSR